MMLRTLNGGYDWRPLLCCPSLNSSLLHISPFGARRLNIICLHAAFMEISGEPAIVSIFFYVCEAEKISCGL